MVDVSTLRDTAQKLWRFCHLYHVPCSHNIPLVSRALLEIHHGVEDHMLCLFVREDPLKASWYYTK